MAHISLDAPRTQPGNPITRTLSAIGRFMMRSAENNPRVRELAALSALSDAELERRGVKREDIALRVFGSWI